MTDARGTTWSFLHSLASDFFPDFSILMHIMKRVHAPPSGESEKTKVTPDEYT